MSRKRKPAPRRPSVEWVAHTPLGFEGLAVEEIRDRLDVVGRCDAPGEVCFSPLEDFDPLVLRCSELCFQRVLSIPSLVGERAGPRELLEAVRRSVDEIHLAARRAQAAQLGRPRAVHFVTRMTAGYPYPRQHLRDKVEREIVGMLGRKFVCVREKAGLEIWITAGPRELSLDVRVSPESHRHRAYKRQHVEGSLRPAAAAGLVRYAKPVEGELFVDPFCGAGTIALERAHYGVPYAGILVGDLDATAAAMTLENFGRRHEPRRVVRWDARSLPLADESVDAVVTNPPFGVKSKTRDPEALYGLAAVEIERVLRPGGRAVILVGEADLMRRAVGNAPRLAPGGMMHVTLQGRGATVFRYFRTG